MLAATHYTASLIAANGALLVTLSAIFAGSLAAGLAAFAFSAISGAMLFHWLAPIEAVPACSITTQLLSITKLWHSMRWRDGLPYLLGGLLGIPIGAKLLEGVNPHVFAAGFGSFLVVYSIYMLLRPNVTFRNPGRFALPAPGSGCGCFIASMMENSAGLCCCFC